MPDEYVNGKRVRSKLVTHWELQDPAKNRLAVAGEPGSDAPRKMGGRTIPGAPYNSVPERPALSRTQSWPPDAGVPSASPLSANTLCGKHAGSSSPNRTGSKMAVTAPMALVGIDIAAIDTAATKKAAGEEAAANNATAEKAKKAAAEEASEAGGSATPAAAATVGGGDEVIMRGDQQEMVSVIPDATVVAAGSGGDEVQTLAMISDDQQEIVSVIPDATVVAAGNGGDEVQTLAMISHDQQEITCGSMMPVHINQPSDQLETASEQLAPATQEREVCRQLELQVRAQMSKKQAQLQELVSSTDQCKRDIGILEAALAQIQA